MFVCFTPSAWAGPFRVSKAALVRNKQHIQQDTQQSYISKGIRRQGIGSFVRSSHVSTLCPVVICPSLCTSEASPVQGQGPFILTCIWFVIRDPKNRMSWTDGKQKHDLQFISICWIQNWNMQRAGRLPWPRRGARPSRPRSRQL